MQKIYRQTQLYKFLSYCEQTKGLGKNILDCGAGGNMPPLAMFQSFGYIPHGIEITDSQIQRAKKFGEKLGLDLNIVKGDIRELPFDDASMSFVYSYNTIFHMTKGDIEIAVKEIKRVLVSGGLCFINFLSHENDEYGKGEEIGEGEFLQYEGDTKIIHSYHTETETDKLFDGMEILFKENRVLHRIFEGKNIKQGYIDYIARK